MARARVLYHYTNADGLLSMVRTGHLWATDAAYMNDPKELRYGYDLLTKVVSAEPLLPTAQRTRVRRIIEKVVKEKDANARVYVASFCGDGDLLSQWRGYASFGGGFAVGLLAPCLLGPKENERGQARVLRRVLYNDSRQKRILRAWIRQTLLPSIRSDEAIEYTVLLLFSDRLMSFKHPSYEEEGEWRLIQFGRVVGGEILCPASFRVRDGAIIPYADLDVTRSKGTLHGKLPIVEIVCGPTIDRDSGLKALRQFCESCGYTCQLEGEPVPCPEEISPVIVLRLSHAPFAG